MFLPPPLKSSAAILAASTEPMPLVSWKMPEISLSTPTRTTSPEISARAGPHAAQDETIKVLLDFDLAGQTTVRLTLGGHAIQQRVFFITHGGEAADPVVVDIHMAGGAHGISAALRHDLVNAMSRRRQHGAIADACFDALGPVVGADESNDRHGIQTGLRVMGRLSKPRSVLL